MIRARLRYPNGQTVVRQGTDLINAALAGGCVIVAGDHANAWPDGMYDDHVERLNGHLVKEPPQGGPLGGPRREKRRRIRKHNQGAM